MKIRTDFVTNSSSSSFSVSIRIGLKSGENLRFSGFFNEEMGDCGFFNGEIRVTVSPQELGTAKSVDELIELLANGIYEAWPDNNNVFIFDPNHVSADEYGKEYHAFDFIKLIRDKVHDIDDIETIAISGEKGGYDSEYNQHYMYNTKSGEYTGVILGEPFSQDGGDGGKMEINDLECCEINTVDSDDYWSYKIDSYNYCGLDEDRDEDEEEDWDLDDEDWLGDYEDEYGIDDE